MLAALLLVVTATGVHAADVGFRGWGPRVGLQSDPDQVIGGAHFDLGEFIEHLRWQPSVEIGFGDDIVSFFGNFMVSYYFPVDAKVTPYAGAQVQAWLFDFDEDGDADFDADFDGDLDDGFNAEIGLDAVGGIETKLKSGTRFLAELQVGIGDVPEIRVLAGWTF
jgi:hypothetical protein